jgi:DNA replication and repair protein RecF
MFYINNITLYQFRNYIEHQFLFNKNVVGICGANGTGKTNILDAIYMACFTKSYFNKPDALNVHYNCSGMRIQLNMLLQQLPLNITTIIRETGKKEFLVDGIEYKKLSEHIGKFPCVMISPDDVHIISEGSEERRKLIDTIICQLNQTYLTQLVQYNKVLQQRNSFIKHCNETQQTNNTLLQTYNHQLHELGSYIFIERRHFCSNYLPMVNTFYNTIANQNDSISLQYKSDLQQNDLLYLLEKNKAKDFALQRTSVGIHKDDILIEMNNYAFKQNASQGQRKSLLFALKLAEWQILQQYKGFWPILLLDDVFEKLDANRMHNLLAWVCNKQHAHIFITDTHADRLQQHLNNLQIQHQLVEL